MKSKARRLRRCGPAIALQCGMRRCEVTEVQSADAPSRNVLSVQIEGVASGLQTIS